MLALKQKGLFLLLFLLGGNCLAQQGYQQASFNFSTRRDTVVLGIGGTLDGQNTFTYPSFKAFEPLQSLRLTNTGTKKLFYPRLVVNDKKNWYDVNSIVDECFGNATTEKDRALSLWKFMRDNRIHRFEPEPGDEINDPVKLLGVYGYGMCYNSNYANAFLAIKKQGVYKSLSNRSGRHFVSQFTFGNNYQLIDGDLETFYLHSDNKTIASYEDISHDLTLVSRTQHYGKNSPFNFFNEQLARFLYIPNDNQYNFGYLHSYHNLDVVLRPGESIEYNWAPGPQYHSYGQIHNAEPDVIANGKLTFNSNFRNVALTDVVNYSNNIAIGAAGKPYISALPNKTEGSIIIKVQSPFVILNSTVTGNFERGNSSNLSVEFSKDSSTWTNVWTASQTGKFTKSINLENNIATTASKATYSYFIKVKMQAGASTQACGVDALTIVSDFQVSRSFLPAFQIGDNSIAFSSTNDTGISARLDIKWKESSADIAPAQVTSPVFPADGAIVDKMKFTFSWPQATDADDNIVDYEFILSDRADLKFPLSPSFEMYTQQAAEPALNQFTIPFDGMLNPGETYYWRVRAKDNFGTWGPWSNTWTFVPRGPAPVVDASVSVAGDSLKLTWKPDSIGTRPWFYQVHASHEALGFTPNASTLLADSVLTPYYSFKFTGADTAPFYRIVAIDSGETRSGLSNLVIIDNIKTTSTDTLRLNESMPSQKVITLSAYHKELVGMMQLPYYEDEPLTVEIVEKPFWVFYNPDENSFYGTPSFADIWSKIGNTIDIKVRLSNSRSDLDYVHTISIPVGNYTNNAPLATVVFDSVTYAESTYTAHVDIVDPDAARGDKPQGVVIRKKPDWINLSYSSDLDLISITGTPQFQDVGVNELSISVFDIANDTTSLTFFINVKDTITFSLLHLTNARAPAKREFSSTVIIETSSMLSSVNYFKLISAPAWLSIDSLTGELFGTPSIEDLGQVEIQIRVTNDAGRTDTKSYILNVVPLPEITSLSTTTAKSRVKFVSQISWVYAGKNEVTFELRSGPSWLSIDGSTLTGTPGDDDVGQTAITLRVAAGARRFTDYVTVIDVEQASVELVDESLQFSCGDSVTYRLRFTGKAPWTVTLEAGGISHIYSNILNSEHYLRLSGASATYSITNMSDAEIEGEVIGNNIIEIKSLGSKIRLVSPNPFKDKLTVNYDLCESAYVSMELRSSSGVLILQTVDKLLNAGAGDATLLTTNLPPGVYVIVMKVRNLLGNEKVSSVKVTVGD